MRITVDKLTELAVLQELNPIENIKHDKKSCDDQWNGNSHHYDPTQGFMSLDADVGQQSQGTQHPQ